LYPGPTLKARERGKKGREERFTPPGNLGSATDRDEKGTANIHAIVIT